MKVSEWIPVEHGCVTRIIEGGCIDKIADRIAFIEKTPRIRINKFTTDPHDCNNWKGGPRYRDDELEKMGYERSEKCFEDFMLFLGSIIK